MVTISLAPTLSKLWEPHNISYLEVAFVSLMVPQGAHLSSIRM